MALTRTGRLVILLCIVQIALPLKAAWQIPVGYRPSGNWLCGIPGGIPDITNAITITDAPYSADNTGTVDCSTAISNAIAACPSNSAIYFPAGYYRIDYDIHHGSGGDQSYKPIVLRGAGQRKTFILNYSTSTAIRFQGNPTLGNSNLLYSGYSKDSSNIAAITTTDLSSGAYVMVGQAYLNSDYFITVPSTPDSTHSYTFLAQCDRITSLSGTNITLSSPLLYEYKSANSPFIRTVSMMTNCGLEDLTIEGRNLTSSTMGIYCLKVANFWIKNVEITNVVNHGITMDFSYRSEIRQCVVHCPNSVPESKYAILISFLSTELLIEDNIVDNYVNGHFVLTGCQGNVIAYNFTWITYTNSLIYIGGVAVHGYMPWMNLFEGNIFPKIQFDDTWGVSPFQTAFRNWAHNCSPDGINYDRTPYSSRMGLACRNDYGTVSWSNVFSGNVVSAPHHYGVASAQLQTYNPSFAEVLGSNVVHGNFTWITNETQWSDPDHTLPNSYYLQSKPSFFGFLNWPPIGPDISVCTNFSITNTMLIPAQARYYGSNYILGREMNILGKANFLGKATIR